MSLSNQLPFEFDHRPSFDGNDYLVTNTNKEAVLWLDKWSSWYSSCCIIYGPSGCGKSHLGNVFMSMSNAVSANLDHRCLEEYDNSININHNIVVDDIDEKLKTLADEKNFLHIYNNLTLRGGKILLLACKAPVHWGLKLADLRSRIKASPAIGIGVPDDELICAILIKLFSDRQIRIDLRVVEYIVRRIERSFSSAQKFVEKADHAALAQNKKISLGIAREVLNDMGL